MIINTHPELIFEEHNGRGGAIGVITLNRPQALNALTHAMCIAIDQQLYQWETDDGIKAVIIQGSGDKAFCAGGDIRHLYDLGKQGAYPQAMQFFHDEYRLNYHIAHYKKPYIAFLNGVTMGGGMGLSIHGRHRVGTENLIMAMPETGIGFFPDIGATHFLSRCPDETGIYLGLTGARMNAADAYHVGLIDVILSSNHLPEILHQLIDTRLEDDANEIIAIILQAFSVRVESSPLRFHHEDLLECFSHDNIERIISALKQHTSPWREDALKSLQKKSPSSLKVTLEALRRGISMNLAACLTMEYSLCGRFLKGHDFYEGIRALLIDKDKQPHWQPATLDDFSHHSLNYYFEEESDLPPLNLL
jgi:enoyl-CoA hydratase/carnithine racemase